MSKEKLLLLHGALGSQKQLEKLQKLLNPNYEVYTLNFEGHGGRSSEKDFSIALFMENVLAFLEEKSIDAITIFGYSMGGYVALKTALNSPEKIKKIITLGTKFDWSLEAAEKEVKLLNPQKIEEKVPKFAQKLEAEHYPSDWKAVMTKTATMMLNMAKGAKLKDDDFQRIQHKIVLGIGTLDNMVSYDETQYVANLLLNAKLVQLEGVKHPIDSVEVDVLVEFITKNI